MPPKTPIGDCTTPAHPEDALLTLVRLPDIRVGSRPCFGVVALVCGLVATAAGPAHAQLATGTYVGDGVAGRSIDLPFDPIAVIVKSDGAESAYIRIETMPPDSSKSLVDNVALVPNRITGFGADAFVVGDDAAVNASGTTYEFIAFGRSPGHAIAGAYVGSAGLEHSVPTGNVTPELLVIAPGNDVRALHKTAAMSGTTSLEFRSSVAQAGYVQSLDPGGFTISSGSVVNAAGVIYYYFALSSSMVESGSYTGTALSRNVNVSRKPWWLVVKGAHAIEAVHKPETISDPFATLHFENQPPMLNGIIALGDAGFTVGSSNQVNQLLKTYYYAAVSPAYSDLGVTKNVDDTRPLTLDTIEYTVALSNQGPEQATQVEVLDELPAGLTYVVHDASIGTYDPGTGIWAVDAIDASSFGVLTIRAIVNDGTGGDTITNTASVVSTSTEDPKPDNDRSSVDIVVDDRATFGADTEVTKDVDNAFPSEGDRVSFDVKVMNNGPLSVTGITVLDSLPTGLTYASHTATRGSYDPVTGVWSVGSLADGGSATLNLRADVDLGTAGLTMVNHAVRTAQVQFDNIGSNNADSAAVTVQVPSPDEVHVTLEAITPVTALPGSPARDVVVVRLINDSAQLQHLRSLTFTNATIGPGTQDELDASWDDLTLMIRGIIADHTPVGASSLPRGTSSFVDGTLAFGELNEPIPSGDTLRVVLKGSPSLTARDGDVLRAGVEQPAHVVFDNAVQVSANWPLVPGTGLTVDGMSRAQITIQPVDAVVFEGGTTNNVALAFVVPANGYAADVLQRFDVTLSGTAVYPDDIAAMHAFADDGDALFDPGTDVPLGSLTYTGARWERTGLSLPVPSGGVLIFVTVDISETATQGATLRLALPSAPDVSIGMTSANDGPLDEIAQNPFAQTISVPDRVILASAEIAPATTAPGASRLPLLQVIATNTYATPRTLTSLTIQNMTAGDPSATQADVDAETDALVVRIDGDDDGILDDIATDPIAGTATFADGEARFTGLGWSLPAGTTRTLFVTGDVSLVVHDGDVLGIEIDGPSSIGFDTPSAIVASWPLDSGAAWTVDGMVAAQITLTEAPPAVLAAGDAASLVFDVAIPRDGYMDDELRSFELLNLGEATDDDFDSVELWRDGGDGVFDPAGDDVGLGQLFWVGGIWRSALLTEPIPAGGVRLFVSVDVSDAPTDSASVRMAVPSGGITVESSNDGPIDMAIFGQNTQLLSGSPLVGTLAFTSPRTTIGQTTTATLRVRNVGTEDVTDVVPTALVITGTGGMNVNAGPFPASAGIAPDESVTFTWVLEATSDGDVRVAAGATGTGSPSGTPRAALETTSDLHRILRPVTSAELFAVENMPFAIGLGETNVVPLTLTYVNTDGEGASFVELDALRVRLEDETGAGIVPADQLTRVSVREGANVYVDRTSLETTGSEIDLTLDTPVVVDPSDPVTLVLRLDISPTAVSPTFRVTIEDSTWFVAQDGVGGGDVAIQLTEGTYPIRSGLGRLVTEADILSISASPMSAETVGPGQSDVPLLSLDLLNPGSGDVAANVVVGTISVSLVDTLGSTIPNPLECLSHLRVVDPPLVLLDHTVTAGDSAIALTFSPPITVPVDAAVTLMLEGDVVEAPVPGVVALRVRAASELEAWDETSGDAVSIVYESSPLEGARVEIQMLASELGIRGDANLPETVPIGASGVRALTTVLRHPGTPETAVARVDTLALQLLDAARAPLDADAVIDVLHLLRNDVEIAAIGGPFGGSGRFAIPLASTFIAPGSVDSFTVVLDIEADAPTIGFELIVDADDVRATDANVGSAIVLIPETGTTLPISSGLGRLEPPADQLVVGFDDHMPAVVAATPAPLRVAVVSLLNGAADEASDIVVETMRLRSADVHHLPIPIGGGISELRLSVDGAEIAVLALAPTDTIAVVALTPPIAVSPGESVEIAADVAFRSMHASPGYRIGLDETDVVVDQPENGLISVRVEPEPGSSFPFFTETGNFTPMRLEESYSNFPNPFAAGRETTTFVFALETAARVSLRLFGPRGDGIVTLLDGDELSAGLHQETRWDGRNGRGRVVRNGVYVAEIVVAFDGGREERLRRKVAVIR